MTYKMYLLDVSLWLRTEGEETDKEDIESRGLLLRGDTARKALALLCPERAEKVLRCRTVTGQAHSLGAGLMLHYIRHEEVLNQDSDMITEEGCKPAYITPLQIASVLEKEPGDDFTLIYGSKGKPYFKDEKFYFSLSHSGDYVLCAVSREEIGADIQECKPGVQENLARRVLTEKEWEYWNTLKPGGEEADLYFYEKWTEKEARGKLTGEGILSEMGSADERGERYKQDNFLIPGYCISLCQYSKIGAGGLD